MKIKVLLIAISSFTLARGSAPRQEIMVDIAGFPLEGKKVASCLKITGKMDKYKGYIGASCAGMAAGTATNYGYAAALPSCPCFTSMACGALLACGINSCHNYLNKSLKTAVFNAYNPKLQAENNAVRLANQLLETRIEQLITAQEILQAEIAILAIQKNTHKAELWPLAMRRRALTREFRLLKSAADNDSSE